MRDLTSSPATDAIFGTLVYRRRPVNLTGSAITALTLRVTDLTTFPLPSGNSDLRPQNAPSSLVPAFDGVHVVRGTTLVTPPNQPNGGGFNSLLQVVGVNPSTPLRPRS